MIPNLDTLTQTTLTTVAQFNMAFNRNDVEALMALMTEDCRFENTFPAPDGTLYEGQAAVRVFWEEFFQSSPSARFDFEEVFAAGERAAVIWTYHWVSAEGQPGHVRGVDILRVRDGKVAEKRSYVKG